MAGPSRAVDHLEKEWSIEKRREVRMASWVILAITVILAAAWAGFAVHVVTLVCAVALLAAYLEPKQGDTEEAPTLDR
jgi:hypothetical protein